MKHALGLALLGLSLLPAAFPQAPPPPRDPPYAPTDAEKAAINQRLSDLGSRLSQLHAAGKEDALLADIEVYHKAGIWILRHPEEFYTRAYYDNTLRALDTGLARAQALEAGKSPWTSQKGRFIRAYRSEVDGSIQPYAVHIPDDYDPARPIRLDVVMHGRGATLNEVSFIGQHDFAKPTPLVPGRIELHVFGRTNNAYRWSGETDVFEALASVESRYRIDPDRIVLRGFSMGGAGGWHIGLHHPDRWAAVESGAGFNETMQYAKLKDPPPYQLKALHIYDAYEYALNAVNVPMVGYGGEIDPQLRASQNVQQQLAREGIALDLLRALFLVGPQTPHRWHPDSLKQSNAFIDSQLPRRVPGKLRFVTYTARYNRCFWVTIDALEQHYERTEIEAARGDDSVTIKTRNVARFTLTQPAAVTIDGQKLGAAASFEKRAGKWSRASTPLTAVKRHGLQGPIDDAFMSSFLLVKQTGRPQHASAVALSKQRFDTFVKDYAKWLRADPRLVTDEELTDAQIRQHNLALFGDPSSNRIIGRIAARLPIRWDKNSIRAGGQTYPAENHLLVLICPNPLNPNRYVVLNSGHSFGEAEFKGTNALLFPRLGDWAVLNSSGEVVAAGFFNERWQM
jgi:pimeloyl-ACP methyl ester carboxylesterase